MRSFASRLVALLAALLTSITRARPTNQEKQCSFEHIVPSRDLQWCPCEGEFFCAKLDVPLDYQYPELGRASMPLIKRPALYNSTEGPYKGMVVTNPGGPGGSGISAFLLNSTYYQRVVGNNYDIVSFDPRGLWRAEPGVNCSISVDPGPSKRSAQRLGGFPTLQDSYFEYNLQRAHAIGGICEQLVGGPNEAGPHMTTAVNVRDLLSLISAFACSGNGMRAEKPHLLNFWGFSYGTFIGQTFASMFPERTGRLVLDGVVDPESYQNDVGLKNLIHTDGVIASFFLYCHFAGVDRCPYAVGKSPRDIYDRFQMSWTQLDASHAAAQGWANITVIADALEILKYTLLGSIYDPIIDFNYYSAYFMDLEASLESGNVSLFANSLRNKYFNPSNSVYPEAYLGVACADGANRFLNNTLDDLKPQIDILEKQSITGEIWAISPLLCAGWSIRSTDVFAGPYGSNNTATPILFVSNTYDSVTPLRSAMGVQPLYQDAEILTIDGTGHSTMGSLNKCGEAKIRAYFQSGQMPGNDSFCPLEAGPFGVKLNGTLSENLAMAGLPGAYMLESYRETR